MSNLTHRPIYQKGQRKAAPPPKAYRSDKIKRSAKGQPCQADWCGCNGSTETTVFCHVRKFGTGGMGIKPADFIGFYGCARANYLFDDHKDVLWSWEGVARAMIFTQQILNQKGLLYAA